MRLLKILPLFVLLLPLFSVFAQLTPTDADKEKTKEETEKKAISILEQIVGDTVLLKLPDNRALVLASAADLLWKRDEKRARALFRQAADEIINANNAPNDTNTPGLIGVFANPSPRKAILQTVAKYDADLALELLYATRPANVVAALALRNQTPPVGAKEEKPTPAAMMEKTQNQYVADEEIRLEQDFAAKAADQDPQKAAKMLRESLAKNGVTTSSFNSLRKINAKNSELAAKLAGEVGQKLLESDFAQNSESLALASGFLKEFYLGTDKPADKAAPKTSEKTEAKKPLKIEAKLAKDLANRLADALLKFEIGTNFGIYFQFPSQIAVLEKIIPERVPLLKQKQAALKKSIPSEISAFSDLDYGTGADSPEKTVASANKMPETIRPFMYKNAVDEAVNKGETEKVREALNKSPAGKERDEALSYLDSKVAESKIKDGKIDEARAIIDKLSSKKEKIERLVQMAVSFHAKDTKEDKETAAKLLEDARQMIDFTPEDEDGINDYFRIASGYAYIEPKTAFTMLENFSYQVNDLVTASALLAKYDKRNQSFKNGELIFTRGLPRLGRSIFGYGKELSLLAKADIDRLRGITDKFQRDDARILLRLYIVQAFFNEKIGLDGLNSNPFSIDDNQMVLTFGE